MLDVHPPHEAAHTWKDFCIHIATIVVGLLIAVGLEQSVEAIHAAHERKDLRSALMRESAQILNDTHNVDAGESLDQQWLRAAEDAVATAARTHQPLPPLPHHAKSSWDVPDNPIFVAAKSSGRLALLSEDEVVAYGEMDGLMQRIVGAYTHLAEARQALQAFLRSASFDQPPNTDPLSHMQPDQLRELHNRFVQLETAGSEFRYWSRQAEGAATVMLQGERDLHRIETAERMFDNKP